MSIQAMSRLTALIALDAEALDKFLCDEESRVDFIYYYRHQLTDEERELMEKGNLKKIFEHLGANLPKPVNGQQTDPGG